MRRFLLLALGFLCCAGGEGFASYAPVAGTNVSGEGSATFTTGAINTTGVDFLALAVSSYLGDAAPTISDSKSNTWSLARGQNGASISRIQIYYVQNPTVGSGHTFTATGSGIFAAMAVQGFSGSTSTPLDQVNSATGSGTSLQPGSVTPSLANELVLAAASITDGSSGYGIDSGFTEIANVPWITATQEGLEFGYKIQTSAVAVNPTFSWTGSAEASAAIATFKASGGAAAKQCNFMTLGVGQC